MLKLVLDYNILSDFLRSQPEPIPIGEEKEHAEWNSLWKFMKHGSDLEIVNFPDEIDDITSVFLNVLTTRLNGAKLSINPKFKKPHKNEFPKSTNVHSVFFIDEKQESEQFKYRKKNGFVFGFINDYKAVWRNLSLVNKKNVYAVRKGVGDFNDWNKLEDYICSFSDIVIVDPYILNENDKQSNLFGILSKLSEINHRRFNLTIISHEDKNPKLIACNEFELVQSWIKEEGVLCDLKIVLTRQAIKEHDRGIFTNYLRIRSGDSFNYFNSRGEIITKGTEIQFSTLTAYEEFQLSDIALGAGVKIVEKSSDENISGNAQNRLLERTRFASNLLD